MKLFLYYQILLTSWFRKMEKELRLLKLKIKNQNEYERTPHATDISTGKTTSLCSTTSISSKKLPPIDGNELEKFKVMSKNMVYSNCVLNVHGSYHVKSSGIPWSNPSEDIMTLYVEGKEDMVAKNRLLFDANPIFGKHVRGFILLYFSNIAYAFPFFI